MTVARPGHRSATSSSTTAPRAPTSGTTARNDRGSSPGSGIWNHHGRIRTRSMPASRMLRCSKPQTAARLGMNSSPCVNTRLDLTREQRMFAAISAAGVFRTDDAGATWRPVNKGLHSEGIPVGDSEVGHCVHSLAMHPTRPETLFMQKHWDVMRTDDAGESWQDVGDNLPTDFGFVIDVHAHEPETIYVVPIKSDSQHFPLDGQLRVYRSRTGGNDWEPLTKGLPQRDCYVNVLRDAMAVDCLDDCGIYFGTTGGQVYASTDAGDNWSPIVRDLPAVLSVEVQTLG